MHCYNVALKMKQIVERKPELFSSTAEEMFVLGLIHDVGYAFVDDQKKHAEVGGEILKQDSYRFWREVYYHGIPQNEYRSIELDLLNYADFTIGQDGSEVSISERIESIAERYGRGSKQERDAISLYELLKPRIAVFEEINEKM